ncbi:hypothetical protein GCM10022384_47740 [Streptomyces marokkonensis]|uniref:Uncharacterized protein n=1 Tax=Streptomyces marokkonensis TaxID=324855 RepID=A0ABP7RB15_9ACTN
MVPAVPGVGTGRCAPLAAGARATPTGDAEDALTPPQGGVMYLTELVGDERCDPSAHPPSHDRTQLRITI